MRVDATTVTNYSGIGTNYGTVAVLSRGLSDGAHAGSCCNNGMVLAAEVGRIAAHVFALNRRVPVVRPRLQPGSE